MTRQEVLIIVLATLIGFVYLLKVRSYDIYEKEPLAKLIFVAIAGGVVSIFICSFLYLFVKVEYTFSNAVFRIGIIEELSKLLALLLVYRYIKNDFNEIVDGIIYITAISLGFSVIENIYYAFKSEYPFVILPLRSIIATLGHISFSGYMGIAFYIHKRVHQNYIGIVIAIMLSSLAHGLYDGFLFVQELQLLFIFVFIALILFQFWFLRTALGFSGFREQLSAICFIETHDNAKLFCSSCRNIISTRKLIFGKISIGVCKSCDTIIFNRKNVIHLFHHFRPILKVRPFLRRHLGLRRRIVTLDKEKHILYDTKSKHLSAPLVKLSNWLRDGNLDDRTKVMALPLTGTILRNIGLKYLK